MFGIVFKTDEIDYKKVRDKLSKNPIIRHAAIYETEIEEIKRYLPEELVPNCNYSGTQNHYRWTSLCRNCLGQGEYCNQTGNLTAECAEGRGGEINS